MGIRKNKPQTACANDRVAAQSLVHLAHPVHYQWLLAAAPDPVDSGLDFGLEALD